MKNTIMTIKTTDIKFVLLQHIQKELLEPGEELGMEEDMLTSGLLDSMKIMRLIGFVETTFKTPIPPEDMVIEHFISVAAIETYLLGRM